MKSTTFAILSSLGLAIFAASNYAWSQEVVVTEEDFAEQKVYSPYAGRAYADQVFFGDTHFHTELSFDAGLIGTTLDVHDGFRMARGETVISNTGQPVQLIRPLDFLVITDHSEMIGLASAIRESSPLLLADPWGKWIHERFNAGPEGRMEGFQDIIKRATVLGENPFSSEDLTRSIWEDFVVTADQYNDPGRFHGHGRVSSGRRHRRETTCIGLSYSVTGLTKPARYCPTACLTATIPKASGITWRPTKPAPVVRPSPYRTTAIPVMV